MSKLHKEREAKKRTRGFLYEASRLLSSVLFIVLTLLPLAPVYADEVTPESSPVTENILDQSIPEQIVQDEAEEVVAETPTPDDTSLVDETLNTELVTEVVSEATPPPEEVILETELDEVTDVSSSDSETYTESTTTASLATEDEILGVATTTETETDLINDVVPTTTAEVPELETPVIPEIIEEPIIEEVASATTSQAVAEIATSTSGENVFVSAVFNDDNKFIFSKNECISVGDGSFYCSQATSTPTVSGADRVFSAVDGDGDREIYVERGGELVQITFNQLDDDAPYYDETSNTIVWHRLVSERYQIISYDVESGEETQITNERYNNMEPSRYGAITVWQGWVGNDWEIMLEEDGQLTMLTDNTFHDISPRINGNYIIWQSFESNAWRVKVYDRLTKKIDTIENADGSSVDNPRFVLVYDTKHENGDVETKGYDLESGEVMPLSAQPTSLPENIPDPEQTGEQRAMVQTPVQVKTKTEIDTQPEPDPDSLGFGTTTDTGITNDIVIPPLDEATSSDTTIAPDVGTSTVLIPDLTVSTTSASEESPVDHIIDLIITPYVEPIQETSTSSSDIQL